MASSAGVLQSYEVDAAGIAELSFQEGLRYFYAKGFSKSPSHMVALNAKPRGRTKEVGEATVGEHIDAEEHLDRFTLRNVEPVKK